MNEENKCLGCYWEMQCGEGLGCEDFTPIEYEDDEADIAFYNMLLSENAEEYEELLKEFEI